MESSIYLKEERKEDITKKTLKENEKNSVYAIGIV